MEYVILFCALTPVAVILCSLASRDMNVSPAEQRLDDEEQLRAISKV
jgi:hypothetical protein